jgi:hypothetical protein
MMVCNFASSFSTSEILAVKFIHKVQGSGNIFTSGSAEAIALAKATV